MAIGILPSDHWRQYQNIDGIVYLVDTRGGTPSRVTDIDTFNNGGYRIRREPCGCAGCMRFQPG